MTAPIALAFVTVERPLTWFTCRDCQGPLALIEAGDLLTDLIAEIRTHDCPNLPHAARLLTTDVEEREQLRARIHRELTDAAGRQARSQSRSPKCGTRWPEFDDTDHVGAEDGCQETAQTCLCGCHDFQQAGERA